MHLLTYRPGGDLLDYKVATQCAHVPRRQPQRPREEFPWFWDWDEAIENLDGTKTFDGNRGNGLHCSSAVQRAAREAKDGERHVR